MKRLILLRHGKSDWNTDAGDHSRPLAPRGVKAAELMGTLLARAGQTPDLVLTSSAVRARTTVERAALAWDSDVDVLDALYGAGPDEVVDLVRLVPDAVNRLMLVGHQPTWSMVAELLTGGRVTVATATAVGIDLDVESWSDTTYGIGTVAFVLPPRLFSGLGLS